MSRNFYAGRDYGTPQDVYQGRMRSRVEDGKVRGRSGVYLIVVQSKFLVNTDERPAPWDPHYLLQKV